MSGQNEYNPEERAGFPVRIEKPGECQPTSILNEMHLWLDEQKIRPLHFQYFPTIDGGVAFYFLFAGEKDAEQFKRQFGA